MPHNNLQIKSENIGKRFGKSLLFHDINFELNLGESFYITGPNGSGKSTLLQIIAGIQKATYGSIDYMHNGEKIAKEEYSSRYGFAGPQVNPYDMLTAVENIEFALPGVSHDRMDSLLKEFGIYPHKSKQVRLYSSGMKQRLRLILALLGDSPALLLDEPTMNLDSRGCDTFYSVINRIRGNKIIIIATNEVKDINICTKGIDLEK